MKNKLTNINRIDRCVLLLLFLPAFFLFLPHSGQAANVKKMTTHNLEIKFDLEGHKLNGKSTIIIPSNTPATIRLGNLNLDNAHDSEGKPLTPTDNTLKIAKAEKPQTITIIYSLTAPESETYADNLIAPQGISLTGLWHPALESKTIFSLTAKIPEHFEAVSEADDITTAPIEGSDSVHAEELPEHSKTASEVGATPTAPVKKSKSVLFSFSQPLAYRHFVAGPFIVGEYQFGDNKKLFTYFFKEDKELARQYYMKTLNYLARYEKLIGPYPYKRFSVVENRLPTGFAVPTFTLLGQKVVRLSFIADTSLGHEVLHSWFGNSIETPSGKENWVEGLTTYLADQAFADAKGKGAEFRKNQLLTHQNYVTKSTAVPLKEFSGAGSHLMGGNEALRAIGYGKASMLFHMLKNKVGSDVFQKTLQAFYQVHQNKQAGWADIEESFEKVSGKDLTGFFKQWLDGKDVPDLKIKDLQISETEGKLVLSFLLVQNNEKPYDLKVPITLIDSGGASNKIVQINKKESKVKLVLPKMPQELIIDANYDLMRKLSPEELAPVWSRFIGAEKKIVITSSKTGKDNYGPLLKILTAKGATVIEADKAKDKDIASASVVFLGTNSSISRSYFGKPDHPELGCVIDVRPNPLNPEQVAVLVSATDEEEVAEAAPKLRHYGKYSYLHFMSGVALDKRIESTENGIHYTLDVPPRGVVPQNTISFEKIIDNMMTSRVIYVGESHTRYEDHVLQLRVIRELYDRDPKIAIGMEMFNRTTQKVLNKYLKGGLSEREFLKKSHYYKMWGYDYRLYRDIINFAKKHDIPIIALNTEKEIVGKVYKEGGLAALSKEEIKSLPPERDLSVPGYRERIASVYNLHDTPEKDNGDKLNDFLQAQTIWDETMAESVAKYLKKKSDYRMVVIAGQGHTIKDSAIPLRVARRLSVKQTVIHNAQDQDIDPSSVDYLLFVEPENLPPQPMLGVLLEEKDSSVLIKSLSPHGKAKEAGFKENDRIVAIDKNPIASLEDVKITMLYKKMGDKATFRIKRKRAMLGDKIMNIEVAF